MNKEEYFEFARKFTSDMIALSEKKNNDYTGGSKDFFANFTAVEKLEICTTEQGFLTRMTDKLKRITGFVNGNNLQVKDESVIDTLQDLANYSILLAGYLKSKKS